MAEERWIQLEFDFGPPIQKPRKRKVKKVFNYTQIAIAIGDREINTNELRKIAGLEQNESVNLVVEYLSLNYTLYSEKRGFYKMLKPVKKEE